MSETVKHFERPYVEYNLKTVATIDSRGGIVGQGTTHFKRVIWIVLDSVGIGELPDAAEYGDVGRDTLGHIARSRPLQIPNLVRLGLANIKPLAHLRRRPEPLGIMAKGATRSPGKDTTTGHWEMAGIWLEQAFPVYPHGFPPELIAEFERQIGRRDAGEQACVRDGNHEGAGRGARAHGISDRLHIRRQRISDRRA